MENKTGCIYVIDCFDTEDFYIGSTVNFNNRKSQHKSNCSNEKSDTYNLKVYKKIREYGGWENWAMFPIEEEIPVEQLKEREQFYIDTLEPSMNNYASKPSKYQLNEKQKQRHFKFREINKDKINEKNREKILCECGIVYNYGNRARHMKSEKHMRIMENKLSVKVI